MTNAHPSSAGSVGFAIQGLNRPGFASKPISTPSLRARRSPHTARQIGDIFEDAGGLFEVVFDEISQGFEIDETINVPPIELDEEFNLIDVSVGCAENGVGAGITVDIAAKGTVSADIGVIAVGTVVPPVLTKFNTVTRLNSDVVGTVTLGGSVTVSLAVSSMHWDWTDGWMFDWTYRARSIRARSPFSRLGFRD